MRNADGIVEKYYFLGLLNFIGVMSKKATKESSEKSRDQRRIHFDKREWDKYAECVKA